MNHVKEGWNKIFDELDAVEDIYSIEDTRKRLLTEEFHYTKYFGKAKNRTMMNDDLVLYKSVIKHTEILEYVFRSQGSYKGNYGFKYRLVFLMENDLDVNSLLCKCGDRYTWNRYCRKCPEPKKTWLGRSHTPETRKKQRKSTLCYLENANGQLVPRYNIESISLLEQVADELGIDDLQHAENGGEFHIKSLGYFVDGYSKSQNIVIEIDESHHFDSDGSLRQSDIERQREIENQLGCTFVRIRV